MKLYSYRFVKNCSFVNKEQVQKNLIKSSWCIEKLYELKEGDTLKNLLAKNVFNKKQYYSMMIQLIYAVHVMKSKGFMHNDLHPGNIMVTETKTKTIKIFNHDIPTYGYIFSIIDYGLVLSNKFKLTEKEKIEMKEHNDILPLIDLILIDNSKLDDYIEKNNLPQCGYKKNAATLAKTKEFLEIKKATKLSSYPPPIIHMMFSLFYPGIQQKLISGKEFEIKYSIEKSDILYVLMNVSKPEKIVRHLISILKKLNK